MKKMFVLLIALTAGGVWAADQKAVPSDVLVWYRDTMGMYTALIQSLDQAQDAKATAKALNQATAAVKAKKLAARYRDLEARYPQFFGDQGDTAWVPPPEWIQITQDYSQALASYGPGLQKAASYRQDKAVSQAFQDFGAALEEIGGDQ